MLALGNGMDAVSFKQFLNLTACFVNGMDVVKSPDLMGGKEYKGHMKNKGISLGMLLLALMFQTT